MKSIGNYHVDLFLSILVIFSIALPLTALDSLEPNKVINNSDCTLSATINSDIDICDEQMITLDANVSGGYDSFEWTSTEGYSNTTDLDPSVFVNTTTTFTFTATGLAGNNSVVNGDFSSGNTGFTSEYNFNPNTNVDGLGQGSYNIDSQTPNLWSNCPPIDGLMMVVNAATVTNVEVYCTLVPVCPNTDYQLSTDVMNINNPPPILQFSANGSAIGSPITGGSTCIPEQFFAIWNSGSATSLEMCVVNQSTAASGNDFALDNVSIEEVCTFTESFEVTSHTLEIGPQVSPDLDCNTPTTSLSINASGSPITSYNWSTLNGNIISDPTLALIDVDRAGIYAVDLGYGPNCSETVLITVTDDFDPPSVIIDDPMQIDCNNPSTSIEVTGSTGYDYSWVLADGTSSFSQDQNNITTSGTYHVTITDPDNGCSDSWAIDIIEDLDTIPVNIAVSNALGCINQLATLTLQPAATPTTILWSNGLDDSNIDVDTAGSYAVTITGDNGCTSTEVVEVDDTSVDIEYSISMTDTLTCTNDSISIYTTVITDNVTTQWTQGGMSVDSDTIIATESDYYYLTLSTDDGCIAQDSVFIEIDTLVPGYTLNTDTLRCLVPSIALSITSDSISLVTWVIPDNDTITQPILDTSIPGLYQVYLAGANGCVDTTTVMVEQEANFPEISISGADTLNCITEQIELSATVSIATVLAEWTLPDNTNSAQPDITITQAGTYLYSVETSDGCKTSNEVIIEIDTVTPLIDFTPQTLLDCNLLEVTQTFTSSEAVDANWYLDNQLISTNNSLTNTGAGPYTLVLVSENGCSQEFPFEMQIDTVSPTLDVDYNTINCINLTSEVIVTTDSDNYTIEQPDLGLILPDQMLSTTEAGPVTVVAQNANGCSTVHNLEIVTDTISPSIIADIGGALTCVNASLTPIVDSSDSDLTYQWTGPNAFDSDQVAPSLTAAGEYSVLVTSDNGCTDLATLVLDIDTISPTVVTTLDLPLTCVNSQVTPNTQVTGSNLHYDWTGPNAFDSDQEAPSLTAAGDYSLTVTNTDNGCTDSDMVQVLIDTLSPTIAVDIAQPFNCVNLEIIPDVIYTGDDLLITWSGPNNFESDLPLPILVDDGDYTIQVTAANGCTSDITFAIARDTATITPIVISDNLTCDNQLVTLSLDNTSDYHAIQWVNILTGDIQTVPSIQVTESGTYQVNGVHTNGCISIASVEVLDLQAVISVDIVPDETELTCDISLITLSTETVTDIVDYTWSSDVIGFTESTQQITITDPGEYTVIVTDVNGCTGEQSLVITQDIAEPNPVITSNPFDCINEMNQIMVEANLGEVILFDSVISSDGIYQSDENTSSTITVSVDGLNGCTYDTIVNYQAFEYLTLSTIDTVQVSENGITQLNATHNRDEEEIVSITWSPSEGLSCDDCLDPIFNPTTSQELTITVTDIYGCVEIAVISLDYAETIDVFVGNIYVPYDDPSGSLFKAHTLADNVKVVDLLSIYDRWGNLIFTQSEVSYLSPDYGWDGTFNGDIVEQGVYVYLIQLTLANDEQVTLVGDVTIIQ